MQLQGRLRGHETSMNGVSKRNRQRERERERGGGGLKGLVEDNDANGCCGDKLRLDFIGMAQGNREVFKHASVMRQGNS